MEPAPTTTGPHALVVNSEPQCLMGLTVGFDDDQTVPQSGDRQALVLTRKQGLLARSLDLEHASYFVSRIIITPTDSSGMQRWRNSVFIGTARNVASTVEHFALPGDRTVRLGSRVGV